MSARAFIALAAACALTAGCSRPAPSHGAAARARTALAGYLPPPQLMRAERTGAVVALTGTASPGARVRLASPDGSAIFTSADAKGGWRLFAPEAAAPRLYSLSELAGGRLMRAVGYIAVLPPPGPAAALLRPAAAAALPPADPERGIAAIDYDASGAAMASGRVQPGESLRLFLDGKEAGEDRADGLGVFGAALSQTLKPGQHEIGLLGQGRRASAAFVAAPVASVAAPPFDAVRLEGAWRIDWMTPGGGVQSTVLFDEKGGRA